MKKKQKEKKEVLNKPLTITFGKGHIILTCKSKGVLLVSKANKKLPIGWIVEDIPFDEKPLLKLKFTKKEALDSVIGALTLLKATL